MRLIKLEGKGKSVDKVTIEFTKTEYSKMAFLTSHLPNTETNLMFRIRFHEFAYDSFVTKCHAKRQHMLVLIGLYSSFIVRNQSMAASLAEMGNRGLQNGVDRMNLKRHELRGFWKGDKYEID